VIVMRRKPSIPGCRHPNCGLRAWTFVTATSIGFVGLAPQSWSAKPGSHYNVDLELVLAADISGSMNYERQRMQREGYVRALQDTDVLRAIQSGPRGRIAVAYIEWASPNYQRVVAPLTVIGGTDDAAAFTSRMEAQPLAGGGSTSISAGLIRAAALFDTGGIHGDRWTIDVSGDGPNNDGLPVAQVRDALVSRGITINGLPISSPQPREPALPWETTLAWYYEGCVIGGPNSFVVAISSQAEFEKALRLKLMREIAGLSPRIQTIAYPDRAPPNCFSIDQSAGH
jgi:hypothetical protein